MPERIPHDFRRTAVRNLERAGGPRSTAMKMVGHRTESIYRRYAIVDKATLKEGAAKLQILHDTQQGPSSNVVRLADAKRLGSSSESRDRRETRSALRHEISYRSLAGKSWWAGTGLNRRHQDFQSCPTISGSARNCLMGNARVATASCAGMCSNNQECA